MRFQVSKNTIEIHSPHLFENDRPNFDLNSLDYKFISARSTHTSKKQLNVQRSGEHRLIINQLRFMNNQRETMIKTKKKKT